MKAADNQMSRQSIAWPLMEMAQQCSLTMSNLDLGSTKRQLFGSIEKQISRWFGDSVARHLE
jgi:hypothetical protein